MSGRGPGTSEAVLLAMPRSREVAQRHGSKYFFTTEPCPKGHVTYRYTRGGCCFGCQAEHGQKMRTQNPLLAFRNGLRIDGNTYGPCDRRGQKGYDDYVRRKRLRYATDPGYRERYRTIERERQRARRARLKGSNPPPGVLAAALKRAARTRAAS